MSIVKIPEHQLDLTNITARIDTAQNDLADLGDQVSNIESKIPAEASDTNQLADKAFVNEEIGKINFVKWVTVLPATGETKYLYAIAREEQDLEGHYIAALYVWDGSAWRGAGGYSLNINPADFALKTDLDDLGVQVSVIESKIPAEASETNQLADKNYVDAVSGGSGFDFEGTKEEFDAAVAAGTITEDSVSLITDDVDGANVATKAELQAVDRSKADTALSNVLANIDYVVESKFPTTDDPTWYRKYKSGWLEQGGPGIVNGTITFLKPFANTKYSLVFGGYQEKSNNGNPETWSAVSWRNKTVTSFEYGSTITNQRKKADWNAFGKGA